MIKYTKMIVNRGEPRRLRDQISLHCGTILYLSAFRGRFKIGEYAEIFIAENRGGFAIKPSKIKTEDSYKVSRAKINPNAPIIISKKLINILDLGNHAIRFDAKWNKEKEWLEVKL
jgi:hypothetical protein